VLRSEQNFYGEVMAILPVPSVWTTLIISIMYDCGKTSAPLTLYPLNRSLGVPQSRSGCGGKEKKLPDPCPGIKHW
jgi:hypothetical protein